EWCADRHRRQEFRDLLAGEYGFDPVHCGSGTGVDRADLCVGDVTSLEREMLHADEGDVVDVGATPLNQARIFASLDALSHELRQYGSRRHGLPLLAGGALNGVHDVLVAGAATEIARDPFADFLLTRLWMFFEERHRGHDHAGRAIAALETVLLPERVLQR